MKFLFLFLACATSLFAQRTAVMTSTTGQVVAPANFFMANALVTTTSTRAPLMVDPAAPVITLSALTVSSLTLSPARWYAVFYIPAGEPGRSLNATLQGYVPRTASTGQAVPATTSKALYSYQMQETYWTDFELKGCTMEGGALSVFWKYFSFDANQQAYSQIWTVRPDVWFFSLYAQGGREARKFTPAYNSIYDQIAVDSWNDPIVSGWVVVVKEPLGQAWFNPYNVNLYWVYRKSSWDTPETGPYDLELWRPIAPVWTTTPPNLSTVN